MGDGETKEYHVLNISDLKYHGEPVFDGVSCTVVGEHSGSLSWEQKKMNAEYIYNYLADKGWSTEAICGVLGNINRECRMNPGAWEVWENVELGYGLIQWSPAKKYLKSKQNKFFNGADKTDEEIFKMVNAVAEKYPNELINSQLDYLIYSMLPKEGEWLTNKVQQYYNILPLSDGVDGQMTSEEYTKAICDPKDLALVFHACYERSGDSVYELKDRVQAADMWYKYFSGEDVREEDFN